MQNADPWYQSNNATRQESPEVRQMLQKRKWEAMQEVKKIKMKVREEGNKERTCPIESQETVLRLNDRKDSGV